MALENRVVFATLRGQDRTRHRAAFRPRGSTGRLADFSATLGARNRPGDSKRRSPAEERVFA
jgi:hypothetical protein